VRSSSLIGHTDQRRAAVGRIAAPTASGDRPVEHAVARPVSMASATGEISSGEHCPGRSPPPCTC